ncbi:MAG: chloride channel protein [Clostridiales bacterium]|jgi:voltage gated chloride channel family|nr:chloride channel protein [Clostridiales bacterium]
MITKQNIFSILKYLLSFLKWVAMGILIGVIIGVIGAAFADCVTWVTDFRITHSFIVLGLPLAGVLIVALYHMAGIKKSYGTNLVLMSVRTDDSIPFAMAPLIFISTVLTHLFGGSAGREGAALQLGGSISQNLARHMGFDRGGQRILTMCGMSACFAALFGTPMTAAIFAMEVISVGIMHYSALVPCAISSITASYISTFLGVTPEHFNVTGIPISFTISDSIRVFVLAALCGVVSILFCLILKYTSAFYAKSFKNPYWRAVCGGVLVAVFAMILHSQDYLGAGMSVITRAFAGEAVPLAFLLKMIFTAITLEAGFKGGEIVPTFFIGATFGCVAGGILGLNPSFGAAIGMISLFCGVTNCPIAALFLSLELFGSGGLLWYFLATAISYMLSGYFSLYSKQKIMYSKVSPEFIDITAH